MKSNLLNFYYNSYKDIIEIDLIFVITLLYCVIAVDTRELLWLRRKNGAAQITVGHVANLTQSNVRRLWELFPKMNKPSIYLWFLKMVGVATLTRYIGNVQSIKTGLVFAM